MRRKNSGIQRTEFSRGCAKKKGIRAANRRCGLRLQNEESFLEGILNGFEYFGGVPKKLIFDNAKVAVKDGFGANAVATDKYKAMAAHYAFTPVFCNVAQGHEKGLVEGLVGFSRRNFFAPLPRFESLDELNAYLREKCIGYRKTKIPGKPTSVGEMAKVALQIS